MPPKLANHIEIPLCELCGQEMELEESKVVNRSNHGRWNKEIKRNKKRIKRFKCNNDEFRITVFSVSTLTGTDTNYKNKKS